MCLINDVTTYSLAVYGDILRVGGNLFMLLLPLIAVIRCHKNRPLNRAAYHLYSAICYSELLLQQKLQHLD